MTTYKQGWNDYLDGITYRWLGASDSWREGWLDCRDACKENGTQQRK